MLDAWGAAGRPYREIAEWLTGEYRISRWWAQKLIVEYEQERGLRAPGIRPDGTFEIAASKTLAVAVERFFTAFIDANFRERWLPGAIMRQSASHSGSVARFDWGWRDAGRRHLHRCRRDQELGGASAPASTGRQVRAADQPSTPVCAAIPSWRSSAYGMRYRRLLTGSRAL
jgi:hypothetical protein